MLFLLFPLAISQTVKPGDLSNQCVQDTVSRMYADSCSTKSSLTSILAQLGTSKNDIATLKAQVAKLQASPMPAVFSPNVASAVFPGDENLQYINYLHTVRTLQTTNQQTVGCIMNYQMSGHCTKASTCHVVTRILLNQSIDGSRTITGDTIYHGNIGFNFGMCPPSSSVSFQMRTNDAAGFKTGTLSDWLDSRFQIAAPQIPDVAWKLYNFPSTQIYSTKLSAANKLSSLPGMKQTIKTIPKGSLVFINYSLTGICNNKNTHLVSSLWLNNKDVQSHITGDTKFWGNTGFYVMQQGNAGSLTIEAKYRTPCTDGHLARRASKTNTAFHDWPDANMQALVMSPKSATAQFSVLNYVVRPLTSKLPTLGSGGWRNYPGMTKKFTIPKDGSWVMINYSQTGHCSKTNGAYVIARILLVYANNTQEIVGRMIVGRTNYFGVQNMYQGTFAKGPVTAYLQFRTDGTCSVGQPTNVADDWRDNFLQVVVVSPK